MTAQAWAAALDAFEQRLLAVRAATEAGDTRPVAPFSPPPGLGPIPADLAPRALELLGRARDQEQVIRQARDAIEGRLTAPPDGPAPRRASRLDVSV